MNIVGGIQGGENSYSLAAESHSSYLGTHVTLHANILIFVYQ